MNSGTHRIVILLWSLPLLVPFLALWVGEWVFWLTSAQLVFRLKPRIKLLNTVLAAIPFLILAVIAQVRRKSPRFPTVRGGFTGAAVAGMAVFFAFWAWTYYRIYHSTPPRQLGWQYYAIELAFESLSTPLWLGLVMMVGFIAGKKLSGRHSRTSEDAA